MAVSYRQLIALSALGMGFGMLSHAFHFYYIKIFLNRYNITESWFQFSQFIFMIWNAVNDPIFAYVQDNSNYWFTRTRRQGILYASPLLSISFLIPWFSWGGGPTMTGLHLLVSLCIWDTLFTFIGMASCCLVTEITQQEKERLNLNRFYRIGSLLGSSSVMILEHASNGLQNYPMFQMTTVMIAGCSCLLLNFTGLHSHTKYDLANMADEKLENALNEKTIVKETYWKQTLQIISDKNFIAFVITNFFQEFHRTFFNGFMIIICDQLVPETVVPRRIRSTFYGATHISSQLLIILATPLISRYTYFKTIRLSFLWKIAGGIVMLMIGKNHPWILMLFLLLDNCFANASFALFNLPLSDIADNNMEKYARTHPITAMVFGTNALVVKPAISLSPMFVTAVLNQYGYNKIKNNNSLNPTQLEDLKNVMFILVCFFPIVVGVVQFISWSYFKAKRLRDLESL